MKRTWILATAAIALATVGAGAAQAAEAIYLGDIHITHQPPPGSYQPEGTDYDLADQGKSFDIACTIAGDGRLSACQADDNDIYDQNFVRIAMSNVSQWVVAPQTLAGESAIGRTLIVTVQFRRSDRTDVAVADGAT